MGQGLGLPVSDGTFGWGQFTMPTRDFLCMNDKAYKGHGLTKFRNFAQTLVGNLTGTETCKHGQDWNTDHGSVGT